MNSAEFTALMGLATAASFTPGPNTTVSTALAANLDAMGFFPCTHAVFGAMADKDLPPMLARVGPMVDRWYFCDLPTARAATLLAPLLICSRSSLHSEEAETSVRPLMSSIT